MGARKHKRAEEYKEYRKTLYIARLRNCPISPRKMRLAAGLIRGKDVEYALHVLKNSPKDASTRLRKLLMSAIANWQTKNEGVRLEDAELFVKEVNVDGGRTLKRIRTAPQGRAHRIRKRSNHVSIILADHRDNAMLEGALTEEIEENNN